MNMVMTRMIFDALHMSGVIPVVSPTVAKALTTSVSICLNANAGSKSDISNVLIIIIVMPSVAITRAFCIVSSEILRLNAVHGLLKATDFMFFMIINMVVVFIPPPVEPGDAPMNISIIRTRSPAFE